jgi:hypothetical protein
MPDDHRPAFSDVPQSPVEPRAARAPAGDGDAPAQVPSPDHAPGRIRLSAGQARQRLAAERARLQQELNTRRQRSGMVDAGFLVQELDARVGGGILAGALAFRIFLFMVPLVYVAFTMLGAASAATWAASPLSTTNLPRQAHQPRPQAPDTTSSWAQRIQARCPQQGHPPRAPQAPGR